VVNLRACGYLVVYWFLDEKKKKEIGYFNITGF
jgi:hypothetical protein